MQICLDQVEGVAEDNKAVSNQVALPIFSTKKPTKGRLEGNKPIRITLLVTCCPENIYDTGRLTALGLFLEFVGMGV
jgi:hypothetical protein